MLVRATNRKCLIIYRFTSGPGRLCPTARCKARAYLELIFNLTFLIFMDYC